MFREMIVWQLAVQARMQSRRQPRNNDVLTISSCDCMETYNAEDREYGHIENNTPYYVIIHVSTADIICSNHESDTTNSIAAVDPGSYIICDRI